MTASRPLRLWLALCCAMIFSMAVIGAITRLTESGLSITRWDVIKGALPPLSDAAWNEAFDLYRQSPQYKAINQGMSLDAFKGIYFWEWFHRLWGRLAGLVYGLPLLFFWLRRQIPAGFKAPFLAALALGGFQGFIGWFMVQSGLRDGMVSVSHFRLAMHLALALGLYSLLFWQWLRLGPPMPVAHACRSFCMRRHGLVTLALLAITICWGAFTAGLDAGRIYPTFPLMNGRLWPEDGLALAPAWQNFVNNPAAVQFSHRWLAILTGAAAAAFGLRLLRLGHARLGGALIALPLLQVALGIATLASGVAIPLAALHQANAVALLTALLAGIHLTFCAPAAPEPAAREGEARK